METTRANQAYCAVAVLYMALELSAKKWVVLFSDGTRRQRQRERHRLLKERTSASNRIGSLLVTQGLALTLNRHFPEALGELRCWDGSALPAQLRAELQRQWERYELAGRHLAALQAQQAQ